MRHELPSLTHENLPSWSVSLLTSLAEHETNTYLHSVRTGMIASSLWRGMESLFEGQMRRVTPDTMFLAGLLHDIKKTDISSTTLGKKESLTPDEEKALAEHPFSGARLIALYDVTVADIIRGHHRFGKNGVHYPAYDADPDARESMGRPAYNQIEAAQLILAIADKADTGINRKHGLRGVAVEEEKREMRERFKREISEGLIRPEWLDEALEDAWQAAEAS